MLGRNSSLLRRLYLISIFSLVPVAVVAGLLSWWAGREQETALSSHMVQTATTLGALVEQDLQGAAGALTALAASPHIERGDWDGFRLQAEAVRRKHPHWTTVVLIDENGQELVNLVRPAQAPLPNVGSTDRFREAMASEQAVVTNVFMSPVRKVPVVAVHLRTDAVQGRRYMLSVGLEPSHFADLLAKNVSGAGRRATLVDSYRNVVARSADHEQFVGKPVPPVVAQYAIDGEVRVFDAPGFDNVDLKIVSVPLPTSKWTLLFGVPADQARQPIFQNFIWSGALVAFLATLTLLVSLRYCLMLDKPFRALLQAGRHLSEGRRLRPIPRSGIAEVDELALAIEQASEKIAIAREKDQAANLALTEQLQLALRSAKAGIWHLDAKTGEMQWSPEVYLMVGLPADMAPSRETWLSIICDEDRARVQVAIKLAIAEGLDEIRTEYRIHHPELGTRWLLDVVQIDYGPDGTLSSLGGLGIDITDLKALQFEAESHRRQAEHAREIAETASRAKSKFLACASHDLRQPLHSLMLLLASAQPLVGKYPELGRWHGLMEQSAEAMNNLLRRLLDLSKLEAGLIAPQIGECRAGDLIARLAGEYQLRAADIGLQLRTVNCGCMVLSDANLLEQILRNLLENALRYTHQGKILVGCRHYPERIELVVADTGIGISPDHMQLVFEEFFQVSNAARDSSQGLGLGLSIVRRAASLVGATVTVHSQLGRGTVFRVSLPRHPAIAERRALARA